MQKRTVERMVGVLVLCIIGLVVMPDVGLSAGLETGLRIGVGLVALVCAIGVGILRSKERVVTPPPQPEVPAEETPPVAVASSPVSPVPPAPARLRRPKRAPLTPRRPRRPARSEQEAIQRLEQAQRELEAARKMYEAERYALRQQETWELNLLARLRNALALIGGYAEMLYKGELGELAASQQYPILIIRRRARQLMTVIQDLETLLEAAEPTVQRGKVNLIKLVEDTLMTFEPECRALRLALRKDITLTTPPIEGNALHLSRVLENLLSNALKFTPEGGTVTVRLMHDREQVVLQVEDTGVGIPEEALGRIFERFYQVGDVGRKYGGSGLGLTLVKEVVQAHHGTVEVKSTVGLGTTFTIRFPIQK